jgi:1,2-diacylglycerol 3-alpha-glucosyltransferase
MHNYHLKISILVKTLAPYAVPRFRAIHSLGLFDVEVLAFGRTEIIREWTVPAEVVDFPYVEAIPDQCVDDLSPRRLRRALLTYLRHRDPDVVIVAGYGDRILRAGVLWALHRKKVTVLVSASTALDRPRFWPKEWVKSLLVRQYDAAFVAGERHAHYLRALKVSPDRIWKGCDVVDNEWFSRRTAEEGRRKIEVSRLFGLPRRFFLYVGRFAPEKNLIRLLEAYGRYRVVCTDHVWGLVLVGSGPQGQTLEAYVRKNRLPDVVFAGFRQIDELPAFYALAGCLVLPSLSEPWGLVVNEAMASGLPVLVSERCGCVPELVRPGLNGYIFDPQDVEALTRLMAMMTSERIDVKRMGEESRRIIQLYSPETWARSLTDCIQQTVARKQGPSR